MGKVNGFDTAPNGDVVGFILAGYQIANVADMIAILRLEYCQSEADLVGGKRGALQLRLSLQQLQELQSAIGRKIDAIKTADPNAQKQ